MNSHEITEEFGLKAPLFEELRREALFALRNALDNTTIKYHSLPSRVKELDSLLKKLQSKQTEKPLSEIQDIVGLRVVCLFLSDVNRIGEVIRNTFNVLSENNKIEGTEVSSFGYMSVHFIVTMREEFKGPRYDKIRKMPFEIQVRTISMDAWANVSHYLDYKSDRDVPEELRKDFYALSGLFYLADRHYEMFYDESIRSREEMKYLFEGDNKNEIANQTINSDSLSAYLLKRFPERKHSDPTGVSELVETLLKTGYLTIGDIDRDIDAASGAFSAYEKANPPVVAKGEKREFLDVGVVRISLEIENDDFLTQSRRRYESNENKLKKDIARARELYDQYRKRL